MDGSSASNARAAARTFQREPRRRLPLGEEVIPVGCADDPPAVRQRERRPLGQKGPEGSSEGPRSKAMRPVQHAELCGNAARGEGRAVFKGADASGGGER